MRLDLQSVLPGRRTLRSHDVELLAKFFSSLSDVLEPFREVLRGVEATQVEISRSIAEPPTHLHQRVVHLGRTKEVADRESLQSQTPRQLVTAYRDYLGAGVTSLYVVECILCGTINDL